MRNRFGWIAGAVGAAGVVVYRFVRRRPAAEVPDARAEELRRKLDESRTIDDREEFEAAETRVDEAEPAPPLDERRRGVHDRARATVDEMRRPERGGK
ncbi:MAG: hypothetical protein WBB74_08370 [Gaiellaceae bacterium]